jgi:hypothetical protein
MTKHTLTESVRENITLSTGTVIAHRREPNGSQFAYIADRPDDAMTEAEWCEYADLISGRKPS